MSKFKFLKNGLLKLLLATIVVISISSCGNELNNIPLPNKCSIDCAMTPNCS